MKQKRPDPETWLEAGLALLGGGLFTGILILLLSRVLGEAQRGGRSAESPPIPGSIPAERHRNIGGAAAR